MKFDPITWAKTHRPQAMLAGGAVGAVGIGLYRRRKATQSAAAGTTSGVPTDATTAASVQPYSDSAGGVPFDPSAFNFDPGSYLAQLSQQESRANHLLGQIAHNTRKPPAKKPPHRKPHTGGHMHVPPPAPRKRKRRSSAGANLKTSQVVY